MAFRKRWTGLALRPLKWVFFVAIFCVFWVHSSPVQSKNASLGAAFPKCCKSHFRDLIPHPTAPVKLISRRNDISVNLVISLIASEIPNWRKMIKKIIWQNATIWLESHAMYWHDSWVSHSSKILSELSTDKPPPSWWNKRFMSCFWGDCFCSDRPRGGSAWGWQKLWQL